MDEYQQQTLFLVNEIQELSRGKYQIPKFNAYHQLLVGSFRCFCVRMSENDLKEIAEMVYRDLMNQIPKKDVPLCSPSQ